MQNYEMRLSKSELRTELLCKRKNYPEKDRLILDNIIKLEQFKKSKVILSYVSKKDEYLNNIEIDTWQFIEYCLKTKKVFVPKTYEHEIVFYEITGFRDLENGRFGVCEPKEYCKTAQKDIFVNSFCLVPALACNLENHRIGYGKGYYDRFLKDYTGYSAITCYKNNILDFFTEKYDVPANIVITD